MWGTLRPSLPRAPLKRFIPTHVGNSDYASGAAITPAVHPHACGELKVSTKRIAGMTGSSPRMWGTLHRSGCDDLLVRFIPTHVGNSQMFVGTRTGDTVHPHACGELIAHHIKIGMLTGSSPRMWGTLVSGGSTQNVVRFIPTHVGNSSISYDALFFGAVHPHACGELQVTAAALFSWVGSSPRMWGTHYRNFPIISEFRFIPTHVGNSTILGYPFDTGAVHPHACGELRSRRPRSRTGLGSSPRMWGTLLVCKLYPVETRFIPTHVGNSRGYTYGGCKLPVHPHACGELLGHGV